jgi:hypothetical protein
LENTVTGDKTWVSSTTEKQNAEASNRKVMLYKTEKCMNIKRFIHYEFVPPKQ